MRTVYLALALSVAVQQPTSQVVTHGSQRAHVVALTFDAGSDRGYAGEILKTLERFHLHATFGMTGRWAEQNGDLVRRMHRDGDAFMNHTYDHRSFTGFSSRTAPLTPAQRAWEINQTDRILIRLTGYSTKPFFRPPYGDYDSATLTLVRALGYTRTIMWTVDSLGWERIPSATILARCVSRMAPGDIYLMHVGSQSLDSLALPGLILALRRAHYRIVTIPELLATH